MPLISDDKEKKRFYLLPGMGGSAYRRKQLLILTYSLVAGLLVSIVVAAIIYFLNRSPR